MNMIKIGFVLLTGASFGFGVDKLVDSKTILVDFDRYEHMEKGYYDHMNEEVCHENGDFLVSVLENLSDEELLLVQGKMNELLIEYSMTIEELNDFFYLRHDFMNEFMDFLDKNEIYFHGYGGSHEYGIRDSEDEWHNRMGMH